MPKKESKPTKATGNATTATKTKAKAAKRTTKPKAKATTPKPKVEEMSANDEHREAMRWVYDSIRDGSLYRGR